MIEQSLLQSLPLFEGIEQKHLALVAQEGRIQTYEKNRFILHQDDSGESFYLILRGTVKVFLDLPDGTEVYLALLGAGDVFGEMGLIEASKRSANVLALETTKVLLIDRLLFEKLLIDSHPFVRNMLRVLSRRLRVANARIRAHCTLDIYGMVAYQLLEFSELYGEKRAGGAIYIPVRLTQTDLAQLVGASRERVNHVMGAYKRIGILSIDTLHHITIHKVTELRRRALQDGGLSIQATKV